MKSVRYLLAALVLAVISPNAVNAEVFWEIQGAGMGFSNKHYKNGFDYMDKKSSGRETSYHAGFGIGLFIPVSQQYPFLLETGLQVRVGSFEYLKKEKGKGKSIEILGHTIKDYKAVGIEIYPSSQWSMQVPVKFNYVYTLNENSSLRFGFGPFFRYSFAQGSDGYGLCVRGIETCTWHYLDKKPIEKEDSRSYGISQSNFMIGLTPSVSYCYRNFSFGMTYEVPVMFFKNLKLEQYPNRYKHAFMLTVGYRFKSKIWSHIGRGLGAAAQVLGEVAVAYAETQSGNQSYSGYTPTDTSNNNRTYDNSTPSTSNKESNYKSVYANHERAAISAYNTLTNLGTRIKSNGKDVGGSSGQSSQFVKQKQLLREIQGRMRKTRQQAAKIGVQIEKSRYEDITVSY